MIFKIRIILDVKQDVIRTIAIEGSQTLEKLHETIANVFGFNGQQMASFYRTDDDWEQGEEIPLINMDDSDDALSMATTTIEQNMDSKGDKLIYVYDFLEMWMFFVEVIEVSENSSDLLPKLIMTVGDVPEKAPEKEFKSKKENGQDSDDDDDFDDEYSSDQYTDYEDEDSEGYNFDDY